MPVRKGGGPVSRASLLTVLRRVLTLRLNMPHLSTLEHAEMVRRSDAVLDLIAAAKAVGE